MYAESLSWVLIAGGLVVVCRNLNHLLAVFIGLEMATLGVLLLSHLSFVSQVWLVYVILCVAVCEAAICLGLLVMVMRVNGSDLMSSLGMKDV